MRYYYNVTLPFSLIFGEYYFHCYGISHTLVGFSAVLTPIGSDFKIIIGCQHITQRYVSL